MNEVGLLNLHLALSGRKLGWAAVVAAVSLTASAGAATQNKTIRHKKLVSAAILPVDPSKLLQPGVVADNDEAIPEDGPKYELKLQNEHTLESLNIVYRIGDTYIPEAMDKLNHFLRDHRTEDVSNYDPREFDLLHNLLTTLRKPQGVIDVVCGYRTAETNAFLRSQGPHTGVAEHSQHIEGKAIDIRVPGVQTRQLRDVALSLESGGVGYYPKSQFVHVDVGPVRTWTFGGVTRSTRGKRTHRKAKS